ncbi:MAG: penicillin-binding protein 2 [Sporichthyaceae bacterium]|nr:penicillin-binding protein 2 [Sporichthyaceae bacterium]
MNKPLRRMAVVVALMFLALLANANIKQVVTAEGYRENPKNRRTLLAEYARPRGPILVGNQQVALSEEAERGELRFQRVYPDGPVYAPVTGYISPSFGATALERTENAYLNGTADEFFVRRVLDLLTKKEQQPGSVRLTLDDPAQQAAYEALSDTGRKGAVVALDPRTGAVLAMVSIPSYDPNKLASNDIEAATRAKRQLDRDPDKPLDNRAILHRYPPGSTFKVVTAAAALASGEYTLSTEVPAPAALDLPQTTVDLPNYDGRPCGPGDRTSLANALRISCNTAFGAIGLDLGAERLRETAERFGLNQELDFPMEEATSIFPEDPNQPQTAQSAIGQFDVALTPLQAAMIAAGVANGGVVMQPYLVQEISGPDLTTVFEADPKEIPNQPAVTPQVASDLTTMMIDVVENGTGEAAQIPGMLVAGKTGTAQHGEGTRPHAWFISFAPANDPQIAVAVVVESGLDDSSDISGGRLAAPIAKAVMEAYLR